MFKIGEFIYPWGNGHFSRMMRFNDALSDYIQDVEIHFSSKNEIYQKLLERFPSKKEQIHEILMPTPIDGKFGPSVSLSLLNLLLPIAKQPPLVKQVSDYLKKERRIYDEEKFDLVVNDGDMGSNILAKNRGIPSLFITNQFMPKLWKSRSFFYPSLFFVAKQIAKATKILVADSPPPYTLCEYNLNFPESVKKKVVYVGHFTNNKTISEKPISDFEKLIQNSEFGYWMRTGNKSTNDATGQVYEKVFSEHEMNREKRIISHAINDPKINKVKGIDGQIYQISEALEKKIDWIQIDIGFLSEQEKKSVLNFCQYAVVNGSHTVLGEILGGEGKPIIGIPVYDEHTNQLKWVEEKRLGILAKNPKSVIRAISTIKQNSSEFQDSLKVFKKNFIGTGAQTTAKIASEILEKNK